MGSLLLGLYAVYALYVVYMLLSDNIDTKAYKTYLSLLLFLFSAIIMMIGAILPLTHLLDFVVAGTIVRLAGIIVASSSLKNIKFLE